MGQSTEELNSQIEDTRQRMASDLDTLQDRVSPAAIVDRQKQAAKNRLSSARDAVMGTAQSAKDSASSAASNASSSASGAPGDMASAAQDRVQGNPLVAGAVAFGAGVLLSSLFPATRMEADAAHRVVEAAKDHGQPLLDDVRSAGQEVADDLKVKATDAVQQVKESAQESAQTVKAEGQSSVDSVKDQAKP